jgi:DNA mismatch endonuclease (patch repair protein)
MSDIFDDVSEKRSKTMAAIKSANTKPELIVRRLVHSLGHRYRLHRKDLPGTPDLAFIGRKKAIFVHGCFWHQHSDPDCPRFHVPKSRTDYWLPKLQRNVERDAKHLQQYDEMGWQVLTLWECEVAATDSLTAKITQFLKADARQKVITAVT